MEDNNENLNKKINLFRNIALTFSGGGYRASTFGLGVLSYFNEIEFQEKPLLENVKGLSTVSGGTLTGATYAYYKAKGEKFEVFYKNFYKVLADDKLLGMALKKLEDDTIWKDSHKRRSLINAFALSYDELLTNGNFDYIKNNKSHLEDICFNSTDFSYGLAFRFQTTGDFGNYRLRNSNLNVLSGEMKLSDAIASSSCFPVGFEPLVMPDDYVSDHKSSAYIAIKAQKDFKNGVGIMDGGIVDNQGIGSIMKADNRRKKGDDYDLIMVCDVGSYFMDPWKPSKLSLDSISKSSTIKQIYNRILTKIKRKWLLWLPLFISIALFILAYLIKPGTGFLVAGAAVGGIAILFIVILFLIDKLKSKVIKGWTWLMDMIPGFLKGKLSCFENLKLRLIQRMLEERGTSALKMINDIFLKQIRRLNYNLFYKDESLKNRRITALIYELTKDQYKEGISDEKEKDEKRPQIKDPGDRIFASAKIASEMGTTLWFTEDDKKVDRLKNLVTCGQFTACYNLLKYCVDLQTSNANVDTDLLKQITDKLQSDWNDFADNPYWLHDKLAGE